MEFRVHLHEASRDTATIAGHLLKVDPAALVDVDASGKVLRIATTVPEGDLLALLKESGCAVTPEQVARAPSTCCGGCSG